MLKQYNCTTDLHKSKTYLVTVSLNSVQWQQLLGSVSSWRGDSRATAAFRGEDSADEDDDDAVGQRQI